MPAKRDPSLRNRTTSADLPLDLVDPERTAIFLDFDGTLVEIAAHPDLVVLAPGTRTALSRLQAALGGALAVVTGRDISDVDHFLAPLVVPVAGVHGSERRTISGEVHGALVDRNATAVVAAGLRRFADANDGVFLERKTAAVALHYRARPELEADAVAAMDAAVAGLAGIHVLRGKMVLEAKAAAANKGGAVADYLKEPPFVGRQPLFAGDDVTDEDAFAVVNARGGISVKIGPGETCAGCRVASTDVFLSWLRSVADRLEHA